jgi:hypothetical protein
VQRCDAEKDLHNTVVGFDPRRQVLLLKRKAKEAMEKKVAAENERLRKLNEVRRSVWHMLFLPLPHTETYSLS